MRSPKDAETAAQIQSILHRHSTSISAASASLIATVIGYPLDSVKSRLQVHRYPGKHQVWTCIKTTWAQEGLRGFFRGLLIPLLTITIVRTTSFTVYDSTVRTLKAKNIPFLDPETIRGRAALGMAGGLTSGTLISCFSCPFELAKIRSQLEVLIAERQGRKLEKVTGTMQGFGLIYKQAGFRGLYFGFGPHMVRDGFGTSLYFGLYDTFRLLISRHPVLPPEVAPFVCGATAGISSWMLIYPFDLVKSRVQRDALYLDKNMPREKPVAMVRRLLAKGGVLRLYRGLGVSAVRSAITHGAIWSVYENLRRRLSTIEV